MEMYTLEPLLLNSFIEKACCSRLGNAKPALEVRQVDSRITRCTLSFRLEQEVQQDDWQCRLTPAFQPDFHWTPHLTPSDRHIIDQHSFRSPALIVQQGMRTLILIPDLELLNEAGGARWYLDLDAQGNVMTLGMSRYQVKEHVLFERAPGARYPSGEIRVGFYLMTFEDEETAANPWRPVLDFLWRGWGTKAFSDGSPKVGPLENYVRHTYDWAFRHWQETVWQEFELEGRRVGAPVFIADVSQSPNYPGVANEREARSIWNQAWFSSLRSAQGLYRFARKTGDKDLVRRALLTKELALAAPQREGWFPSVIATRMEPVEVDGQQINRSRDWSEAFWGNSNRNPLRPWTVGGTFDEAPYHILDMSWTALLMLRWHEELEPDERLLAYARRYAEALLGVQDDEGFFPAWLHHDTLKSLPELARSPETSMSVTFLLALYRNDPDPRYRDAALQAMKAVRQEIIMDGRWEDFETYWSCSPYGHDHLQGRKVERNNMYKQCNLSMFWTAEALFECYRETDDTGYLADGERCLDEMLMTQASWQPGYIYVEALGGFGVMNADGEWNDARQSLFAELILRYGMELGRMEYIERGLAALRASFVMMYCPENEKTRAQWEKAYPFFNESDYGFMMENYGHGGKVNAEGMGMGTFTIYDWGNGAAAEAYLRIRAHWGEELQSRFGVSL